MADIPDPEAAVRTAIRHWRLPELAEFAVLRHGFGDSDGGFGVTYPTDLAEYDREVEGRSIPSGHVAVYGFWGPPEGYRVIVPESTYLVILAEALAEAGLTAQSSRILALAEE
jgi:hypothetical protein